MRMEAPFQNDSSPPADQYSPKRRLQGRSAQDECRSHLPRSKGGTDPQRGVGTFRQGLGPIGRSNQSRRNPMEPSQRRDFHFVKWKQALTRLLVVH